MIISLIIFTNPDHTNFQSLVLPDLRGWLLFCYHPNQAQYQLDVDPRGGGTKDLCLRAIRRHYHVRFDEHHRVDLHSDQLYSRRV